MYQIDKIISNNYQIVSLNLGLTRKSKHIKKERMINFKERYIKVGLKRPATSLDGPNNFNQHPSKFLLKLPDSNSLTTAIYEKQLNCCFQLNLTKEVVNRVLQKLIKVLREI